MKLGGFGSIGLRVLIPEAEVVALLWDVGEDEGVSDLDECLLALRSRPELEGVGVVLELGEVVDEDADVVDVVDDDDDLLVDLDRCELECFEFAILSK